MQSQNEYIGDDKFTKLLQHYNCPMRLDLIKMRFAGAICSPNLELRPTDVISSLWPQGQSPRLQTKEEAELFFKFFMGLWNDIFNQVKLGQVTLPAYKINDVSAVISTCFNRREEIEDGFVEGFWGGCDNLQIPAYIAQIIDSFSDLAKAYLQIGEKASADGELNNLLKAVNHTDKTVNRAIAFVIDNFVLPRFEKVMSNNQ